jgi:hypothetical protein
VGKPPAPVPAGHPEIGTRALGLAIQRAEASANLVVSRSGRRLWLGDVLTRARAARVEGQSGSENLPAFGRREVRRDAIS